MAVRSSRFRNAYASFQSTGFRNTKLSSYGSTLARRQQSAEDKVIDDNFKRGLIDTETYLRHLQGRTLRPNLTPLQRENLNIKIRDVQLDYQDQLIQTAYETGGTYKGMPVDDEFMYEWEKAKLEEMDPNSTTYQKQVAKVQNLEERYLARERSDYRRQRLLEISQMPDSSIDVLREKVRLYNELADQAEADGDLNQADTFRTSANNYEETLKKAEIQEDRKAKQREISQESWEQEQGIRYGAPTVKPDGSVAPTEMQPGAGPEAPPSGGYQGPAPAPQTPIDEETGQPRDLTWLERIGNTFNSVIDELANVSAYDIQQYLDEADLANMQVSGRAIANKEKAMQLTANSVQENVRQRDAMLDFAERAEAQGLVDYAEDYYERAEDYDNRARAAQNKLIDLESDLVALEQNYNERAEDAQRKAVKAYIESRKDRVKRAEKELDMALTGGRLTGMSGVDRGTTKDVFIDGKLTAVYALQELYERQRLMGEQLGDDEMVYDAKEKLYGLEDDVRTAENYYNNKENYDLKYDRANDEVKLVDITEFQRIDDDGVSDLDKTHARVGDTLYELTITDKDGQLLKDSFIKNADIKEIEDDARAFITIKDANGKDMKIDYVFKTKEGEDGQKQFAAVPTFNLPTKELSGLEHFIRGTKMSLEEKGLGETVQDVFEASQEKADRFVDTARDFLGGIFGRGERGEEKIDPGFNLGTAVSDMFTGDAYATEAGMTPVTDEEWEGGVQRKINGVPEQYQQYILDSAEKHGIRPEFLAAVLKHESADFQDRYVKGYHTDGSGRGVAAIDKRWHPEVSDEQAFDPEFAIDWSAKYLSNLKKQHGSEYNALRAYNGGGDYASSRIGWAGRTVAENTKRYADTVSNLIKGISVENIIPKSKSQQPAQTGPTAESVPGLRSQQGNWGLNLPGLFGGTAEAATLRSEVPLRSQQPKGDWDNLRDSIDFDYGGGFDFDIDIDRSKLRSSLGGIGKDVTEKLGNTVRNTYSIPTKAAESFFNFGQNIGKRLGESIVDWGGDRIQDFGDNLYDTYRGLRSKAEETVNRVKDKAGDWFKKLRGGLRSLF